MLPAESNKWGEWTSDLMFASIWASSKIVIFVEFVSAAFVIIETTERQAHRAENINRDLYCKKKAIVHHCGFMSALYAYISSFFSRSRKKMESFKFCQIQSNSNYHCTAAVNKTWVTWPRFIRSTAITGPCFVYQVIATVLSWRSLTIFLDIFGYN